MERTDDVEQLFFKFTAGCFVFNAGLRIVKDAGLACACRAHITAGVAADAAGQLPLPECKAFVGGHGFKTLDFVETVRISNIAILNDQLVIRDMLFRLAACTAFCQHICHGNRLRFIVVKRMYKQIFAVCFNLCNTVTRDFTDAVDIRHAVARNTDGVNTLTIKAVLGQKLVKAVCITGL